MPADPRRPGYHFTAPGRAGSTTRWASPGTRTPDGGRYELFYQFNPDAPVGRPACRWGQVDARRTWSAGGPADRARARPGRDRLLVGLGRGRRRRHPGDRLHQRPRRRRRASAGSPWPRAMPRWRRWTPDPRAGPPGAGPEHGPRPLPRPVRLAGRRRVADGRRRRAAPTARPSRAAVLLARTCAPGGRTASSRAPEAGDRPDRAARSGSARSCSRSTGRWVLLVSVWDEEPGGVACARRRLRRPAVHPARLAAAGAADPLYATTAFRRRRGPAVRAVLGAGARPRGRRLGRGRCRCRGCWRATGTGSPSAPHPDVDSLRTGVLAQLGADGR